MEFVEAKFFSKNDLLDMNLKNEIMSKNCPRKLKKCKNEQQHTKIFYIENVWKMMIMKIEENHENPKWV